jgi:hypothetical protein
MITVSVQGGLGNQLFQYAYGRALLEEGKDVIFDTSFFDTNTKYTKREYLLDKFLISDSIKTQKKHPRQKFLTRILNKIDITRRVRYVSVSKNADNFYADGYYVSEKYFKKIREIILKEVTLRQKSDAYKEWEEKIKSAKKPLMIHARRTDHILNKTFTFIDEKYYEEALKHFDDDCELFGFSDNAEWLQNAIKGRKITMVSGQGFTDYEELMLMSLGKNFIIANSTYSWWAAWLSQAPNKKIVALKKWYASTWWSAPNKDVEFDGWTRI